MKKLYTLIIVLGCVISISAQSKTWIGPSGGFWSNEDNWSPEGVPGSNINVLILSGSVVNAGPGAGADTLTVQSGATLNRIGGNNMVMTRGYFEAGSVLNMYEGDMVSSGITIDGVVNSIGSLTKGFWGGIIEVNNSMTIDADSGPLTLRESTLQIGPNAVLNLPGDGIIDIAAFSGTLENQGLIQKTGGAGDFIIDVTFVNNGGTLNVNSGNMLFQLNTSMANSVINVDSGASILVSGSASLSGILTGLLDGPLELSGLIGTPTDETATFDFTGAVQVEWSNGPMHLGDFINEGILTLTAMAPAYNGFGFCSLINNGVIDMAGDGSLSTSNGAYLHNSPTGSINLLSSNTISGGSGSSILNEGLITKAESSHDALITTPFTNDGGTISVLGDTLAINYSTLTNGQYDVGAGAALYLGGGTEFNGTLTGQLDGPMELRWGNYNFTASDTTVFNFSGAAQVDWYSGTFVGGNLKNMSTINAKSLTGFANQISTSHIVNEGLINVNGLHGIYMYSPSSLLNTSTGVIDIQADNFIQCGAGVTNLGLFKKSGGMGVSPINGPFFHDDPALVHVEMGTLNFASMQPGNGDFAGAGTLILGNYLVEGDVSPGNSPGTLTIAGDYTSSASAMLNIEMNGTNAGVDYDVLAIEDAAILKGGINLTMGFSPTPGEEFEIITAMNVDSCLLPATVSAVYDGANYTYDVICNADNVTLGLLSVGLDDLSSESLISVYPNPMSQTAKIDLGEAVNRSPQARLVVTNRLGQTIRSVQIPQGATSVNLDRGGLPSGLYNLQLIDDVQVKSSYKLLIE